MPTCNNCKEKFPYQIKVEGKEIDLRSRKYCLECNPLGERNFWRGKRVAKKENGKRGVPKRKFTCTQCGNIRIQKTRNLVCSSCRSSEKRHQQRVRALELKGGKCLICEYNTSKRSLDFHHLDESTKKFTLASAWEKNWKEIEQELEKCILLCSNCHGELHDGFFCLIDNTTVPELAYGLD